MPEQKLKIDQSCQHQIPGEKSVFRPVKYVCYRGVVNLTENCNFSDVLDSLVVHSMKQIRVQKPIILVILTLVGLGPGHFGQSVK